MTEENGDDKASVHFVIASCGNGVVSRREAVEMGMSPNGDTIKIDCPIKGPDTMVPVYS